MVGKKGMSPIIATILLIAFAVALGAMIMTWGSTIVAGDQLANVCEQAKIEMRGQLCYKNGNVKIDVKNSGTETIQSLILEIKGEEYDQQYELKQKLDPQGAMSQEVPASRTTNPVVLLIPKVKLDEENQACPQPAFNKSGLPPCVQ